MPFAKRCQKIHTIQLWHEGTRQPNRHVCISSNKTPGKAELKNTYPPQRIPAPHTIPHPRDESTSPIAQKTTPHPKCRCPKPPKSTKTNRPPNKLYELTPKHPFSLNPKHPFSRKRERKQTLPNQKPRLFRFLQSLGGLHQRHAHHRPQSLCLLQRRQHLRGVTDLDGRQQQRLEARFGCRSVWGRSASLTG